MPDIFDQVATPQQPQQAGSGDIFDQIAPTSAAPTPQASQPATPAPTTPVAPQQPDKPWYQRAWDAVAPDNPLRSQTPDQRQQTVQSLTQFANDNLDPTIQAAKAAYGAGKDVVTGLRDVFTPTDAESRASGITIEHGMTLPGSGGAPMTPQEKAQSLHKVEGGAARFVTGAGTGALAIDAPGLLELGGLAAGMGTAAEATAARIALTKVVAGAAAGTGAAVGAGAASDKLQLAPETKQLVQAVSFFLPSLLGVGLGKAGFQSAFGTDADGNLAAGAATPGGGARVGARVTPEAYEAGAQVGDTKFNVRIPRTPAEPTAAQVTAQQMLTDNLQTMKDAQATDAAAQAIVNGASPADAVAAQKPQPPDLTPDEMRSGVLSPEMTGAVAQTIKASPKEMQPGLMMQAAGKLSAWIQKVKQFVGPDGKLEMAENPQQADKLAQKIFNAEVDRHDAATEAATKQAQDAASAPPEANPTTKGQSKLQQAQAEKQYARAKTMIESSNSPEEALTAMGRAGMTPEQAQGHITRYTKEQIAAQTPAIGSTAEPVVEESRATTDAQIDALKAGTVKVVHYPEGQTYRPPAPAGMKVVDVGGDAPGAGRFVYNPREIKAATIREAAKAGTHGDLLGHVQDKEELAGKPTVAVVAHKPDGTEIQASEVEASRPDLIQNQAQTLAERHPGAQVSVKPTDQVIGERLAAKQAEGNAAIGKKAANTGHATVFEVNTYKGRSTGDEAVDSQRPRKTHYEVHVEAHHDVQDRHLKTEVLTFDTREEADAFAKQHNEERFGTEPKGDIFDEVATKSTTKGEGKEPEQGGGGVPAPSATVRRIEGHDGKKTTLTVDDEKHPVTYRLVEADDVHPSHDAVSFAENPKGIKNTRDYNKPDAKNRVITQAQNIDTDYLVTNNPDAVNGPPIIEPGGQAYGGNSRAMTIQRAYRLHPDSTKKYVAALREHAESFGFTREQVDGMKKPMLVREMEPIADETARRHMIDALNNTKTAAHTPGEKAVKDGHKLDQETMDEISRLIDSTGDGASIRDMLREHGLEAIKLFEKAGIITAEQRPQYVENNLPSEAGKELIENAILGKVVDDPKLMDTTPRSILNKLDSSLAAIAHIDAEADEYNIIPVIRDALDQHAEISKRKTNVQAFQQQTGLMEQRTINPVVDAIARKLVEKPNDVKKALRGFAADAKDGRLGQGSLMGPPPTAADAFNHAFGTTLSEEEYRHGLARGVSEEEPRAAASRAESGDSSLQASSAGEPEASGPGEADRGDGGLASNEQKPGEDTPEHKYKFGNVQHNIEDSSPAAKALDVLRSKIAEADLAGDGKDVGENHVTVRYGLKERASDKLKAWLRAQAPFKASLGEVIAFPAKDDAAPLVANVEAPELHRINGEIDQHDDFEPSSFPDYRPHATVAYVKPEAASKYTGDKSLEGKTFMVRSIAVGDRDGNHEEIALEGKPPWSRTGPSAHLAGASPLIPGAKADDGSVAQPFDPRKGDRIRYKAKDGTEKTGVLKQVTELGVRVAPDGGGAPDFISKKKILGPADSNATPAPTDQAKPEKTPTRTTKADRELAERNAKLAEHFTPGNVIHSSYWRSYDKVLEFTPATAENSWSVKVVRSDKDGNPLPGERPRTHSTYPDAKDEIVKRGEPVAPAAEKPAETAPEKAEENRQKPTLTDHLLDRIKAGAMPKDNNALRALVAEYDGKPVEQGRMKEAQEALEAAIVQRSREIVKGSGANTHMGFTALLNLYESQPNLNIRTTTSIENQAYSTPAPLAYLADKLAGVNNGTTVYEPTAGNGMLLIAANPSMAEVNELNPDRAAALKAQGFKVRVGDALDHDIRDKSVDAVVTNPPFGSVKGDDGKPIKALVDGYKIGQIDHLIAAKALNALKDEGKATLILGANKVSGGISTDDRIFFNWLYSHYNVASHFEVEGYLYSRQGAGWPVRVISITGRERSDRFSPLEGTIERVKTWKGVYEQFTKSMDAQASGNLSAGAERPVLGSGNDTSEIRTTAAGASGGNGGVRPSGGAGSPAGIGGAEPKPLPDSDVESASGLAGTDNDVRPDADVSRSDRLPKRPKREPAGKRDAGDTGIGSGDLEAAEPPNKAPAPSEESTPVTPKQQPNDPDNQFQVDYTPASSKKDAGVLIPTNMRAPLEQAMLALQDAVGDIDQYVADELNYDSTDDLHDALMGLQTDSVASAIYQMHQGKGVIIGDQTGIGKGRQAAAIIRWAVEHDKIPVFMTVKPSLFTDMYGDLADIGTHDVSPFIVNSDESIKLPNGALAFANKQGLHRRNLEKIVATGELPDQRNAVFLTYSQINTDNTQRSVLRALAHKAVFILDESHNAAGESSTGEYMRELLKDAAGVTYLSATYAKRPDNMPLYFKTDIGMAIADGSKLADAMANGGLALQTVVSNNLVRAGQFFRRERSYDGVKILNHTDKARGAEHRVMADKVTEVLRAIVKADRRFHYDYVPAAQAAAIKSGQTVSGGGNKADSGITHQEFASVVHNSVRQLLLGLKVDEAAARAIERIRNGEKPIIAVESTMGSFLSEYAANNNLRPGDQLGDFGYRAVMSRALERSRALTYTDKQGNKTKVPVSLAQIEKIEPDVAAEYRKAQAIIDKLDVDIPMSPIDYMRKLISDAGFNVKEITGRDLAVDYSDPKAPRLAQVDQQEQSDKVQTTRDFNGGKTDALVVNVAGSTGISLHASEKFKDQRPRHMIVAQPAQDINIFMQMLGRIHRTGQVALPGYTILGVDLPAEKRPNALLAKKMKSLNANTSSNTESATSVKAADMLNKYGDQIVAQYLRENPSLALQLRVDPGDASNAPPVDLARSATGRLAILPVEQQEAFYRDVEQQYADHIDYLNDTNQNDLEPRTYDYEAREIKSQVMVKGEDPSTPFGEDAIYNEYSVKAQSKPLSAAEVLDKIKTTLGDQNGAQHAESLIARLDKEYKDAWGAQAPSEQWADVKRGTTAFIRMHPVGSTLRLMVNGDEFSAAVVNIESTHKGSGNPFSLSKVNVTVATTGPQPNIKVPATQLAKITVSPMMASPGELFQMHRPPAREMVKVVTGNLLAAYGEIKDSKGTIIHFTKEDGTQAQGILLPKKFDIKENTTGDYRMRSPEHILKYLNESTAKDAQEIGVASRDGDVRVVKKGGRLIVVTPRSKARGAKYFLDKRLTALTGDFVSSGASMRATVPQGKELAVLGELSKKAAFYVSRSMAEDAERYLPAEGEKPKPSTGGMEMRASLFGVDLLAQAGYKIGSNFFKSDVAPVLQQLGSTGLSAGRQIAQVLAPRAFANTDSLNLMMKMKGEKEYSATQVEHAFRAMEKMIDMLPREAQIDFIDAIQTGQQQPTPELQQVADALREVLENQRETEIEAANLGRPKSKHIELPTKENYFPNKWATRPGKEPSQNELDRIAAIARSRRPLEGSKGYNKMQSYTLREGVEAGGVPADWNAVRVMQTRLADGMKFVTARRMIHGEKKLGRLKFFKLGERLPDGWSEIEDRFAKVYFPADSGEGQIHAGRWAMPESDARLLNNYLSPSWFTNNAVGRGIMAVKMATTGIELAMSPFHFFDISIESIASQMGLGMMQAINKGIGKGDPAAIVEGLKDMLTSPLAPVTMARTGGAAIKTMGDPGAFLNTPRGRAFIKDYPDAPRLIRLLFHGGITTGMPREFRTGLWESMREAARDENYLGAVLRAVPAVSEQVMKPLFEHYIPAMKMGYAIQGLSQRLAEEADRILAGDITEDEIARQVVDAAENNFGEMNFTNLFWHNTFKGAMQLMFRSVTWKLTNWRGLSEGVAGQAKYLADPLKTMYDDVRGNRKGADRTRDEYMPKIDLNMGRLIGVAITTAVLTALATRYMTGKWPWDFLEEDKSEGKNLAGALALELSHARTGQVNAYSGKPIRWTAPTGFKDYEYARRDPGGYVRSSLSGMTSKALDTWNNKDFFGNYVYDPNGPMYRKLAEVLTYNAPENITLSNIMQGHKTGDYSKAKMGMFGLTTAPRDLDMSKLEKHMESLQRHDPKTPDEEAEYERRKQAIKDGGGSHADRIRALKEARKPFLLKLFRSLTYVQAKNAFENYASPEEQHTLRPALNEKRMNALKRDPATVRRVDAAMR